MERTYKTRVEAGCGFSDQAVMINCHGGKMH